MIATADNTIVDQRLFDGVAARLIISADSNMKIWASFFVGSFPKFPRAEMVIRGLFDGTSSKLKVETGGDTFENTSLSPGSNSFNGPIIGGSSGSVNWLGTYSEYVFYDGDDSATETVNIAHLKTKYAI